MVFRNGYNEKNPSLSGCGQLNLRGRRDEE
jgi:hypothetical protein